MTLYGFAVGLTAVVVIVAVALAIQALWLVRRTRRLRREVEERRARLLAKLSEIAEVDAAAQRMKLGEMLRENLDLRFPGQSQAGPRAGSSPRA